ncbi:MAG: hypothetical protein AAFP90_17570 [Planctomycetota bacterium]
MTIETSSTIVDQLKVAIADARQRGFRIRQIPLGDTAESDWVEISGERWLLLNAAHDAGTQLQIVRRVLCQHQTPIRDNE